MKNKENDKNNIYRCFILILRFRAKLRIKLLFFTKNKLIIKKINTYNFQKNIKNKF